MKRPRKPRAKPRSRKCANIAACRWVRAERDGARDEVKHERKLWDGLNDSFHEQAKKHREQQTIALDVIISLQYALVKEREDSKYFLSRWSSSDQRRIEADKALASYVQSYQAHNAELRAILEAAHYDVTGVRYLTAGEYERAMELVKG